MILCMILSFLTGGLVMAFGYAYPAYKFYKTVEMNEIEQLRFWCQYWILVAILTVCDSVGYAFISWIPMYSQVKLAFLIYLWYPKTRGTSYVYDSFFRPYIARHLNEIDRNLVRNLLELRSKAARYCQMIISQIRQATTGTTEKKAFVQSGGQSSGWTHSFLSSGGTRDDVTHFEAKVAKLVELGFTREMVLEALESCDGDEEKAAGILFGD